MDAAKVSHLMKGTVVYINFKKYGISKFFWQIF
jgi:hypothetical protein